MIWSNNLNIQYEYGMNAYRDFYIVEIIHPFL